MPLNKETKTKPVYQDEEKKSAINKKLILRLRNLISKWFQLKTGTKSICCKKDDSAVTQRAVTRWLKKCRLRCQKHDDNQAQVDLRVCNTKQCCKPSVTNPVSSIRGVSSQFSFDVRMWFVTFTIAELCQNIENFFTHASTLLRSIP